jgi:hypothetical protein
MVLSTLGRVIWVPIAFLISSAVAALVLLSLGQERVTQALHVRQGDGDAIGVLFYLVRDAYLLISGLSILPALLLVIVGEIAHIRSPLYYVVGGGLALAAMPLIARIGQGEMPADVVWQVFATAGFAGGFVYWLIAGRRA